MSNPNDLQLKSSDFLIKSKLNGFVLDVTWSSMLPATPVIAHPINGTNGTPNQRWTMTEDGLIKSQLNGFVLDIIGSSDLSGTPVIVYPINEFDGTPNQRWTMTEDGLIKSQLNDFVLDIAGSSDFPGTPVIACQINGSSGTLNQQWELVPVSEDEDIPSPEGETQTQPKPKTLLKQGPKGSSIDATDFDIQPKEDAPQSRIKTLRFHAGWAVDKIQVVYEDVATNPPQTYESEAVGGGGGSPKEFSLETGDYITEVLGSWGSQAPGYPKEEIISLQFQTNKGVKSPEFGGGNSNKEIEPFCFVAPQGYEVIGFFGSNGSHQNSLVRLGVYLRAVAD